jgi:hypothetical protein
LGKHDHVGVLNLKETGGLQGMNHLLLAFGINNYLLMPLAQSLKPDSISIDSDIVHVPSQKEAFDLRLPQLEALMSEDDGVLIGLASNIQHDQVESINVDRLVADNQLLYSVLDVTQHLNVGVPNVQLVLVLDVELRLVRI